jgi:glucose-6-phosphate 1-epimerase
MTLQQGRSRFSRGNVRLEAGQGGLPCLQVRTPLAEATVYLYGGHVTHFRPAGERPLLFVSSQSAYETGKPIRGGVPVCFPWFGGKADDAAAPLHGVARLQMWELDGVREEADGMVEITLSLRADETSRQWFKGEFHLRHRVRIGRELSMSLITRNAGKEAFEIQEALHSYFLVGDVTKVSVTGLEATGWLDKVQGMKSCPASHAPISISAETDRTYTGTDATTAIVDPSLGRRITIAKSGSRTTVVWNPWIAKSAALPDFGDNEWAGMLCVETANALGDAVTVAPGAEHTMTAHISVARL